MNIDHAKYFLMLSNTQHIQKAAHLLGISSTAISHGVAKLEEELNVKLTAKSGRNIILTEKGIEFARRIQPILEQLEKVREGLGGEVLTSGLYKMAVTHNLFPFIQNKKIFETIQERADISLELQAKRSAEVVSMVADGSVDFGFCLSPMDHPSLERKLVHRGKLILCARKQHPVFKIRLHDSRIKLMNETDAIGIKASFGIENCESHPSFKKLKLSPNFRFVVDTYDLKLAILKQVNTWALIPDFYLEENKSWLQEIDLGDFTSTYTIEAIWNKNRSPLRLYKLVLDSVIESFRN